MGLHEDKAFLGAKASEAIYQHLHAEGYIDSKGKIQDSLKQALADNKVNLPDQFAEHAEAILATIGKVAKGLSIKKYEEKKPPNCVKTMASKSCWGTTSRRCGTESNTRPPTG